MTTMLTRATADPAAQIFSDGATVIVDAEGAVLSFPAATATAIELHHAIRLSSGLIHAAMPSWLLDRLRVPDQPVFASERSDATFTVAVDAASGIGTGISAHDRARTLRVLADRATVADDLLRPGHVLPVRCDDGGFRARRRCWELAVDLVAAGGLPPVAVVARLVDDNGDVLDADAALAFAVDHGLPVHWA
jgi:3,4-dihydroxy 2-butanone 4-phosphate synthase